MSDGHDEHHAHIETPAPFLFCVATAIMFIGLVMATAGGEDKTGDTGYWFVFILGIMGMFTAFFMWIQEKFLIIYLKPIHSIQDYYKTILEAGKCKNGTKIVLKLF